MYRKYHAKANLQIIKKTFPVTDWVTSTQLVWNQIKNIKNIILLKFSLFLYINEPIWNVF
jgi:hypothetical protein